MVELWMDDREDGNMFAVLQKNGMSPISKRLKIGDYQFGDEVIIERKTIDDLSSSILDNRLEGQLDNMKDFKHRFLLVSGRINDRHSKIHENCLVGMMVSVAFKYGVFVICVDDDKQLGYAIKRIIERYQKKLEKKEYEEEMLKTDKSICRGSHLFPR